MKLLEVIVLPTSSTEAGQKTYTVAGLPLSAAIAYTALFAVAVWFYSSLWPNAPIVAPDSASYVRAAYDLSDFRVDQLNSRPPGYPLLLVLTGRGRPLFYTSLSLHFASIWLLATLLYAMGLTWSWLVLLGSLLLLPPYLEYAAYILSDNLSTFLLAVAFASLVFWFLRGRGTSLLILSGIAMGCSGLTRPTYQTLALVVSGCLLISRVIIGGEGFSYRRCIKAGLILLTVSFVFIGGFSLLNYVKFNFFGVYPMMGFNLSTRTARVLERLPDEYAAEREVLIKARDAYLIKRDSEHTPYQSYWWAVPELVKITGLKEIPDLAQHMLRLHLILIKKAPLYYLQEVFTSFANYWLPSATELANMNSFGVQALWVALHFGVLGLFLFQLIVIVGVATFRLSQRFIGEIKGESRLTLPPGPMFAYFLAGTIIFYNAFATSLSEVGDPRYRIPTEPLIIFMCFLGFYIWRQLLTFTSVAEIRYRAR